MQRSKRKKTSRNFSTVWKRSIETLRSENQPVVFEKSKLEFRENSIAVRFLTFLQRSGIRCFLWYSNLLVEDCWLYFWWHKLSRYLWSKACLNFAKSQFRSHFLKLRSTEAFDARKLTWGVVSERYCKKITLEKKIDGCRPANRVGQK